jgi:hypothetical protein
MTRFKLPRRTPADRTAAEQHDAPVQLLIRALHRPPPAPPATDDVLRSLAAQQQTAQHTRCRGGRGRTRSDL